MKKLYFLALLLLIATQVNAQSWQWQSASKYTNITDPVPQHMIRHNDHLFISGIYSSSAADTGIFVMAVDTSGNLLWTRTFDVAASANAPWTTAIVTDNTNIYVSGAFEGTLTAGSTTLTSAGYRDGFIAALDMSGNPLWAEQYGGGDFDFIADMTVANQQVYLLSSFAGTAIFGSQTVTSTGGPNLLLAQLNTTDGNMLWHTVKDVSFVDEGRVRITSNGDFIISGNYSSQFNADTVSMFASFPYTAAFLLMLNSSGTALWAETLAAFSDIAQEMELDNADSIYVELEDCWNDCISKLNKYSHNTSTPSWSQDFQPESSNSSSGIGDIEISGADIFVVGVSRKSANITTIEDDTTKLVVIWYDNMGNAVWADTSVLNNYINAEGIVKGGGNELYVLGAFRDTIVFGGDTLISTGADAMFIAKIGEPVITGISYTAKHERFDLYPNPSNGTFRVNGQMASGGPAQLFIRNIHGQVVYKEQVHLSQGAFDVHISMGDLANGMYVMELVSQGTIYRQKLVIERQ